METYTPDDRDLRHAEVILLALRATKLAQGDTEIAGGARDALRWFVENCWEKRRESGPKYGQYRLNMAWSPDAVAKAEKAWVAADKLNEKVKGQRELVKEHVETYADIIDELLRRYVYCGPEDLARYLNGAFRAVVITTEEDQRLREAVKEAKVEGTILRGADRYGRAKIALDSFVQAPLSAADSKKLRDQYRLDREVLEQRQAEELAELRRTTLV